MDDVEALLFDVFGTVVDWHGSVTRYVQSKATAIGGAGDTTLPRTTWEKFASEWRRGYIHGTRRIAGGGEGTMNVDMMHRQILDEMLDSPEWDYLGRRWNESARDELNLIWHRLDAWPDSSGGLYALKRNFIIAALSNGNVRLLIDLAKHADLPWDFIFSAELLGAYKPNPKTYLQTAHLLSLPSHKCAMVAMHVDDLRAAASRGFKTVYVRRKTEDVADVGGAAKTKQEGGEFDVVVDSLEELAVLLGVKDEGEIGKSSDRA